MKLDHVGGKRLKLAQCWHCLSKLRDFTGNQDLLKVTSWKLAGYTWDGTTGYTSRHHVDGVLAVLYAECC